MKYNFKRFKLKSGKELIRINFETEKYEGIERFFNDDAFLLTDEIDNWIYYHEEEKFCLAGNRTYITFLDNRVIIEDQWDTDREGCFEEISLSIQDFRSIYNDWKTATKKDS